MLQPHLATREMTKQVSSAIRSTAPGLGKTRTLAVLILILAAMSSLVAASPILYDVFCRVTGYGGRSATLDVYERPLGIVTGIPAHDHAYQVLVDATVSGSAPIEFISKQRKVDDFHVGQRILLEFSVLNTSDEPIVAQAIHTVLPEVLAPYLQVQECFCTSEETLEPGNVYEYALVMRFDPAALEDPDVLRETAIRVRYEYLEKS